MMIGAYIFYSLTVYLKLSPFLSFPLVVVAAALLGRPLTSLKTMQDYDDPEVFEFVQRVDSVGEEGRYATGTAVATIEVTLKDGTATTKTFAKDAVVEVK